MNILRRIEGLGVSLGYITERKKEKDAKEIRGKIVLWQSLFNW